jgi:hypothetical protein
MKQIFATIATALLAVLAALQPIANASAANVTVPNGITTTDLNAVGVTATSLATQLAGAGVSISNVVYHGDNAQAGQVSIVDPQVAGFNSGVILSSGNVADIVGPNKSDSITGVMTGANDTDLDALIAGSQTVNPLTYDAASLEFDFVPTTSKIYFTYVFGSDEYLEWVNQYNDVFGFFVNGHNCATVPDPTDSTKTLPVSIDTINSTVNSNLFRDNSFSNPPANPINIESDGLSVELVCSASVNAGQTNHLKLAIADTSDQVLDSVVMIKAGSLSTVAPESCNNGVDDNGNGKVDSADPLCQTTTTPAPAGQSGIGDAGSPPPFTGVANKPIALDAAAENFKATSDAVSTSWQVHGINGTVGDCTIAEVGKQSILAGQSIAIAHATCPKAGEYTARIDGWDSEGSSAFDYDVDFFVQAGPPSISINPLPQDFVPAPGQNVTITASLSDIGAGDSATCTFSWGDGAKTTVPADNGTTCQSTHAYDKALDAIVSVVADSGTGVKAADLVTFVVGETIKPPTLLDFTPGKPAIVGTAQVGNTLTANVGDWSPAATTYTYSFDEVQNLSDVPTVVSTASSYVLKPTDLGKIIVLKVHASKDGYNDAANLSNAVTVKSGVLAKTATPKVTGTIKVGKTVKVTATGWDAGVTFSYQWLLDGKPILKATASSYKLLAKQKGHKLSVKVVGAKLAYTSVTKTSLATKIG